MKPAKTKPEPFRAFGIKLPASMRTAVFDEAARRTRIADEHVSAGSVIREAIEGHLARLSRSRQEAVA